MRNISIIYPFPKKEKIYTIKKWNCIFCTRRVDIINGVIQPHNPVVGKDTEYLCESSGAKQ